MSRSGSWDSKNPLQGIPEGDGRMAAQQKSISRIAFLCTSPKASIHRQPAIRAYLQHT